MSDSSAPADRATPVTAAVAAAVGEIETLLAGRTHRKKEARILEVLASCSDAELNDTLGLIELQRLFGDIDNHSGGPAHYAALLDLLARQRGGALSVKLRCAVIKTLQRGHTNALEEQAIEALLLDTRGRELTRLKNALDTSDNHHDLQQLLFHDIDETTRRQRLLDHFDKAAKRTSPTPLKILSDIDDTFYANWKDARYPKKTIYPGVLQLYLELDRNQDDRLGDLVFVTARPGDRAGLVERATHRSLRARGIEEATILTGSFRKLIGKRRLAAKKLENFARYAQLFPEYDFVFIGDSGQGDASFGVQMRQHAPKLVRLVLIHDVVNTSEAKRDIARQQGLWFFDSYVGAATIALEHGLIDAEAAWRVCESAKEQFAQVRFSNRAMASARQAELLRDEQRLSKVLQRSVDERRTDQHLVGEREAD